MRFKRRRPHARAWLARRALPHWARLAVWAQWLGLPGAKNRPAPITERPNAVIPQLVTRPELMVRFQELQTPPRNPPRMLDEVASMPGAKGIMLTFGGFLEGLDPFGGRIQPLMACRQGRLLLAAE